HRPELVKLFAFPALPQPEPPARINQPPHQTNRAAQLRIVKPNNKTGVANKQQVPLSGQWQCVDCQASSAPKVGRVNHLPLGSEAGEKTAASAGKLRLQSIFCDRKVVGGRPSGNPYESARSASHPSDRFISFASQKSCVGNFATVIANQDEERIPCPARRASLKLALLRVPRHWKIQSRC